MWLCGCVHQYVSNCACMIWLYNYVYDLCSLNVNLVVQAETKPHYQTGSSIPFFRLQKSRFCDWKQGLSSSIVQCLEEPVLVSARCDQGWCITVTLSCHPLGHLAVKCRSSFNMVPLKSKHAVTNVVMQWCWQYLPAHYQHFCDIITLVSFY